MWRRSQVLGMRQCVWIVTLYRAFMDQEDRSPAEPKSNKQYGIVK